jgi:hypothetical protein
MCCEQSTGLPKGREPYGDGASIVVSGRESRLHGHRGVKAAQRRSEAGFPWPGRQGTRDANSRHDPQHYLRPRQTIGQSQRNKETGEPDDATSIQSGSAGGWEKRPKGPRSQPTQLQSSKSTFSRGNFLSFFAFQEGMLGTPISVLGGWPTVSGQYSRLHNSRLLAVTVAI